jgi:hypothetical protein
VAEGGGTFGGRVVFAVDFDHEVINPYELYSSRINYYTHDSAQTVSINVGGSLVEIDLAAVTSEAMAEWQAELGHGIAFQASSLANADLEIVVDDQYRGVNLAQAYEKNVDRKARLKYFPRSIEKLLNEQMDVIKRFMGNDASNEGILKFLFKYAAKHELGHVLGFEHVDFTAMDTRPGTAGGLVIIPRYSRATIPIMTSNLIGYMRALHDYNGRGTIDATDIAISAQEGAALSSLYEATLAGCSCCVPNNRRASRADLRDPASCPYFNYSVPGVAYEGLNLSD